MRLQDYPLPSPQALFLLGYTISPPDLFFGLKKVNSAVLSQQLSMPLIGTTQKSLHSTAIKVKKYIYNNNIIIIIIIVKLQSSPSMGNYWNCYF